MQVLHYIFCGFWPEVKCTDDDYYYFLVFIRVYFTLQGVINKYSSKSGCLLVMSLEHLSRLLFYRNLTDCIVVNLFAATVLFLSSPLSSSQYSTQQNYNAHCQVSLSLKSSQVSQLLFFARRNTVALLFFLMENQRFIIAISKIRLIFSSTQLTSAYSSFPPVANWFYIIFLQLEREK